MSVLVVGISHRTAPVDAARAGRARPRRRRQAASATSPRCEHVTEATVLATCNRVEIYAEVDRFHGSVEEVSRLLVERAGAVAPRAMLPHLYVHYDDGAVSHLFSVASGLDSMVVGEGQILGQTREALRLGQEHGTVGPALNVLFQQALRVGKRAHAETGIDRAGPSLVSAALDRGGRPAGGSTASGSSSSAPARWPPSPSRPPSRLGAARDRGGQPHRGPRRAARRRSTPPASLPLSALAAELASADLVDLLHRRRRRGRRRCRRCRSPAPAPSGRSASSTWRCRTTSTRRPPTCPASPWSTCAELADELRDTDAGREVDGVREIVAEEVAAFLSARRQASVTPTVVALRSMATAVVDAEIAAADGPAARTSTGRPRRGRARRPPGGRQAAPRADRAGQGAGRRGRRGVLRRRARRAVRPRPRGGRRRHPAARELA